MLRSFVVLLFSLSPFLPFFFFPYFQFFKFISFLVVPFSWCDLYMLQIFCTVMLRCTLFNLHYFQVALFSCSTPLLDFLMHNVLHCCIYSSCSFAMLYFFLAARFSYGTLFILILCYTLSVLNHFESFRL